MIFKTFDSFGMLHIVHDVCTVGGMFYYDGTPLDNAEVERRLKAQGDIRPFTTKDGVRPFPAPKTVDF